MSASIRAQLGVVTAERLHDWLLDGRELAVLDAREPAVAQRDETLLLAVSFPESVVELRAPVLVPRRSTRIVVVDARGDDEAPRVAVTLAAHGYANVSILQGGVEGWKRAGHQTYAGTQALGQAFGEVVEAAFDTPHLAATDVAARVERGDDIVLIDSRPLPEFSLRSIPGAVSSPGAELVYRFGDVVTSPSTTVVVNCAGRTRSILGAQALINAGVANPVYALDNGTMAWSLQGLPFAFGSSATPGDLSDGAQRSALEARSVVDGRFGVRHIDHDVLATWTAERDDRSLYVLDIRTPEEYAAGHLPGSRSAPSWDLVPWVFRHVGTRHARLVLVDSADTVRATLTASWLQQIGWGEVVVLDDALADRALASGPAPLEVLGPVPDVDTVLAAELAARQDVTIVDVGSSIEYEDGHVAGAWFAVRSRLPETAGRIPGDGLVVVTAGTEELARLAALDVATHTGRPVAVLAGGTPAWRADGHPTEPGIDRLLDETVDVAQTAWRSRGDRHAAFRSYLTWEVALRDQIAADDTAQFALPAASAAGRPIVPTS